LAWADGSDEVLLDFDVDLSMFDEEETGTFITFVDDVILFEGGC
jgi:hypothetical protein